MRQTFDSLLSYMPGLGHLGVNLLIALAILVVGWIVSIAAGRAVHRLAARSPRIDRTIVPMIHSITVWRSEEHTSELQSLMRISYAVFCLKKKKTYKKLN